MEKFARGLPTHQGRAEPQSNGVPSASNTKKVSHSNNDLTFRRKQPEGIGFYILSETPSYKLAVLTLSSCFGQQSAYYYDVAGR